MWSDLNIGLGWWWESRNCYIYHLRNVFGIRYGTECFVFFFVLAVEDLFSVGLLVVYYWTYSFLHTPRWFLSSSSSTIPSSTNPTNIILYNVLSFGIESIIYGEWLYWGCLRVSGMWNVELGYLFRCDWVI